ncbi:MAG: glycosyl hydrolase family 95 catalytic domain-containing protein, partial [Terrimicrobiaceae bacterium]
MMPTTSSHATPVSDSSTPERFKKTWAFPLTRTHTGIPLGNGRMGALVWGGKRCLNITFGRADFWDHRGGKSWKPEMNYLHLHQLLAAGNEPEIRRIFSEPCLPGHPARPTVLPIGRIELRFPAGSSLVDAELDLHAAILTVRLVSAGKSVRLALELCQDAPLLEIRCLDGLEIPEVVGVPAWEFVGAHLASVSFQPPEKLSGGIEGWRQKTPADEAISIGWVHDERSRVVRVAATIRENLNAVLSGASCAANAAWWKAYWARVPTIDVPDEAYASLLAYGLYKFSGLTRPSGVAATLQGPWIEEYQMPPWSSDYHFNINVQMCYWPTYQAGLFEHLMPLFRMIEQWLPTLRQNAKLFVGIDDGYLLPHAVDDRCGIIGAFWTGTVDHACTAWVARMMFDYW